MDNVYATLTVSMKMTDQDDKLLEFYFDIDYENKDRTVSLKNQRSFEKEYTGYDVLNSNLTLKIAKGNPNKESVFHLKITYDGKKVHESSGMMTPDTQTYHFTLQDIG